VITLGQALRHFKSFGERSVSRNFYAAQPTWFGEHPRHRGAIRAQTAAHNRNPVVASHDECTIGGSTHRLAGFVNYCNRESETRLVTHGYYLFVDYHHLHGHFSLRLNHQRCSSLWIR